VVSFVPQFFVAHWLAIYHPAHSRADVRGEGFLSLLAGYLLGGALFLLLQRLKPLALEQKHDHDVSQHPNFDL
jgi:hypothetical protein